MKQTKKKKEKEKNESIKNINRPFIEENAIFNGIFLFKSREVLSDHDIGLGQVIKFNDEEWLTD